MIEVENCHSLTVYHVPEITCQMLYLYLKDEEMEFLRGEITYPRPQKGARFGGIRDWVQGVSRVEKAM